uniref:NIDO domain-containing protein n=1 Tax=Angiostrongylus cantonensis TaxID=6313 RepID=A0A0K0D6V4_ANGCA
MAFQAGFNRGDNSEYYALPTSGTGNIMYLEEYGNTGIPGEWMFELGEQRVARCKQGIKGDTCDEECAFGEWGADCALCCHCGEGTCHPLTGECPKGCAECWTGGNCQSSG